MLSLVMTKMVEVKESLFLLEAVVDQISLPGVTCRFPSVAVRLMDFPTLMIDHVDERRSRRIQLNLQQMATLPPQFAELLDENENFPVKKGKSCLFKFCPKTLRTHLSKTPLYVLVVDTYPDVPKLVASCVTPLCQSMNRLYDHITNGGLAIPMTDGWRGQLKLRNLMGVEVGHIIFGYRLISLGEGLLHHVNLQSIAPVESRPVPKQELPENSSAAPATTTTPVLPQTPSVLPVTSKTAAHRNAPEVLEISKIEHIFNDVIERGEYYSASTQTDTPKGRVRFNVAESQDDVIYKPPPLFFNSQADERRLNVQRQAPAIKAVPDTFDYESETVVDGDTYDEPDEPMIYTGIRADTSPKRTMQYADMQHADMQYADMQQSLSNFPVLRALMDELNRIERTTVGPLVQTSPKSKSVQPRAPTPTSAFKGKENRRSFLTQLTTPNAAISLHADVPKHKIWKRKETLVGPKKPKLSYGMTNTQRLRLAKNNPFMLPTRGMSSH